jgi:hypothetical protein
MLISYLCVILYCSLRPVVLHCLLAHFLINGTNFGEDLLNIKCAFRFSLQVVSETFLIMRTTQRGIIIKLNRFSWKLLVFFSEFIHTSICIQIFDVLKYIILWKFVQCEPSNSKRTDGRTVGQTHITKQTVALRYLANATKDRLNEYISRKKDVTIYQLTVQLQTQVGVSNCESELSGRE